MRICDNYRCEAAGTTRCPQDGRFCATLFGFRCRHNADFFCSCSDCQHHESGVSARSCPARLSYLREVG